MQQSQASQVHKELQDTMAQLEAIRYEIRSISFMNPAPFARRLEGVETPSNNGASDPEKLNGGHKPALAIPKDLSSTNTTLSNLHSQAMAYAKLVEASMMKSGACKGTEIVKGWKEDGGPLTVLPISAESAGLLPKHRNEAKGSDIVLEAILEADVARNAKHFFSQPQNQIP